MVFHRIVVALGASARCREVLRDTGSLVYVPGTPSPLVAVPEGTAPPRPFVIGDVGGQRGFVHVLDDENLEVALRELDTIADFVDYLTAKESFVRSDSFGFSAGEENLVAFYLMRRLDGADLRDASSDLAGRTGGDSRIGLGPDIWTGFMSDPVHQKWRVEVEKSKGWDALIESFTDHVLNERMITDDDLGLLGHEERLRALASASRIIRIQLAEAFRGLVELAARSPNQIRVRTLVPMGSRIGYILILFPYNPETHGSYEEYRSERQAMLRGYALVLSHLMPELEGSIGLATEPPDGSGASEDVIYADRRQWIAELDREAEYVRRELNILPNGEKQREQWLRSLTSTWTLRSKV